uniref:Uncharacterized protein n=1 Tax=Vespula pensylvanica TaxID=30213 RepID=A0A834P6N6_VESPE|nr:hypothetical protein H0235_006420 [Vespula pensylvanica]
MTELEEDDDSGGIGGRNRKEKKGCESERDEDVVEALKVRNRSDPHRDYRDDDDDDDDGNSGGGKKLEQLEALTS